LNNYSGRLAAVANFSGNRVTMLNGFPIDNVIGLLVELGFGDIDMWLIDSSREMDQG
jgi:hypothetical protein